MRLGAGLRGNIWDVSIDGAGGLILSAPGARGIRTLPSPGGDQTPSLPLSPVGLHLNIMGGAASISTERLRVPLYGEGAAHYHFNGSLHKY